MMTYVASVVKDTFDRERNGDDNNSNYPRWSVLQSWTFFCHVYASIST